MPFAAVGTVMGLLLLVGTLGWEARRAMEPPVPDIYTEAADRSHALRTEYELATDRYLCFSCGLEIGRNLKNADKLQNCIKFCGGEAFKK